MLSSSKHVFRIAQPVSKPRRTLHWLTLFLLLVAPSAHAGTLDDIRARGILRWGADIQGGEPYVFQDPNNDAKLVGFEVEIADALARRLGVKAEMVQNDWSTLVPSLERGDFDIIMNGLEITAARRGQVAFSQPYFDFDEILVVRKETRDIARLTDLRGKRVGTLTNSLAHEVLRATPEVEVVLYEGVEEPYIDLEQGRTDAVLLDDIIADRYGLIRPALRSVGPVAQGSYAIAVRPADRELLNAIDSAMTAMIAAGELREILTRWHLEKDREEIAPEPARKPGLGLSHVSLFFRGAAITLVLSALAMTLAVSGGLLLSIARQYAHPVLGTLATIYVEVMRGTPLLLQLYLLYYGLAPIFAFDAFTAAVLGLGMNYAAYEAELYRAGLSAVPVGQTEAALALGMSRGLTLRRIIFPQALRVALPGMANDFIALLKDSSLVSVITVVELTKQMSITAVDVRSWLAPGLLCAGLYLAMSFPLSRLARHLERRLAPGA